MYVCIVNRSDNETLTEIIRNCGSVQITTGYVCTIMPIIFIAF